MASKRNVHDKFNIQLRLWLSLVLKLESYASYFMIFYGCFSKRIEWNFARNELPYLTWRHRQGGEKTLRRYNSVNIAQNQEILHGKDNFSQTNRSKPYVEACDTQFKRAFLSLHTLHITVFQYISMVHSIVDVHLLKRNIFPLFNWLIILLSFFYL